MCIKNELLLLYTHTYSLLCTFTENFNVLSKANKAEPGVTHVRAIFYLVLNLLLSALKAKKTNEKMYPEHLKFIFNRENETHHVI